MKLLLCRHCEDLFKLRKVKKICSCGKCGGLYTDNINVTIFGDGILLGFDNTSLIEAIRYTRDHPDSIFGENFTAFVIPLMGKHYKRVDKIE
jgi:aspartate oxidase